MVVLHTQKMDETSLVVWWLKLCASCTPGGTGWILGQGTKILMLHGVVKKKKNEKF